MDDWKKQFKEIAEEFIQRRYDEQHGYIRLEEPEKSGFENFYIVMALPVGIFLFLNGFVFLFSGFRSFIRFFPDNLVMLIIIALSFVLAFVLKKKEDDKIRAYEEEKNKLSVMESKLDALAKDHPEVPRWWKNIPVYSGRNDNATCSGSISHTKLEETSFFRNQGSTEEISGKQVNALLKKTDKFLIITDNDIEEVSEEEKYSIGRAEVNATANFGRLGQMMSFKEDDYKFVKRSMYLRMCDERDRQTREIVQYTDDISPKEPGETGLSKEALEIKSRREKVDPLVKQRFNGEYQSASVSDKTRDAQYNIVFTARSLGYAIYTKEEKSRLIALAIYKNVQDARYNRLYMQGSIKVVDPVDPEKTESKYNYVVGSYDAILKEEYWRGDVNFFLEERGGWIDTDFVEKPRWGMNQSQWQAFILSHRKSR